VLFTAFNIPLFNWQQLPLTLGLLMIGPAFLVISSYVLRPGRSPALREGWALGSASFISVVSTITPAYDPDAMALCGYFLASVPVIWVLAFLRLRLRDGVIFASLSVGALGGALIFRSDIDADLRLYPFMFMIAAALPALAAMRGMARAARKVFLHTLLQQLQVAEMAEQNILLETLSNTDALTGVANRRRFDRALAERFALPEAADILLLIDIDHFKEFNDLHGHLAGDDCLRAVARVIASQLRPCDLVARFGGEEFAVLLPNAGVAVGLDLAERIRDAVASSRPFGLFRPETITVSIGLADRGLDCDATLLIARADAALYAAKRGGRNMIRQASEVWGVELAAGVAPR